MKLDFMILKIAAKLIPPIVFSCVKRLKDLRVNRERRYAIGKSTIVLPKGHKLDLYQKEFPLYDKFITVIPKYLPKDSTVIDIGANVGDSAVPFLEQGIKTICIEPSELFSKYLNANIKENRFENISVVINKLVSSHRNPVQLLVQNGTATIDTNLLKFETSESLSETITLDEIAYGVGDVSFIKIDTDGFDFDVLNSGLAYLKEHKPLVFFENVVNETNIDLYEDTYDSMMLCGYNRIAVLDNIGYILIKDGIWNNLKDLNYYMLSKEFTCYPYMDVLCYTDDNAEQVEAILNDYKQSFLNNSSFNSFKKSARG